MVGEDRRVILAARKVVKDYPQGDGVQRVLDHLSLEVDAGRFVAIMGRPAPASRPCSTCSAARSARPSS